MRIQLFRSAKRQKVKNQNCVRSMFFTSFYGIFLPYYDAKRIKSIPFSVLDIFANHCRSPLPLPLHLKCGVIILVGVGRFYLQEKKEGNWTISDPHISEHFVDKK